MLLNKTGLCLKLIILTAYLPVKVGEFEVEEATGETAEAQIWAEACGASQQRVGVHPGTLKIGHPCLTATQKNKTVKCANDA